MLDFLNDLKLSPENSFISHQNESVLSPFPQPFPSLEGKMELEDFFSEEEKKEKRMKKKRGNKKDDFDYNKYIEKELRKTDVSKLDSNRKKKLIQKIRNRMSA